MKFELGLAALCSATLAAATPVEPSAFTLRAKAPCNLANALAVSASIGNLWLNLPEQNATCQHPLDEDIATFYLRDTSLYLYSTEAAPQIVYTDRSGMGQGKVGYLPSGQGGPRNAEFDGWSLNENNNFNIRGSEFVACPSSYIEGAWSLWVSVGIGQPGGNENCVKISAHAVDEPKPISCRYSQYEA